MDLNYDALEKDIATEIKPLYLIYGEEQYLVQTAINKIKKTFGERILGINYIQVDESNVESLISVLETPAFGYDKKLVIVKNSGLFKKDGRKKSGSPLQDKIADYITNNFEIIEDENILIFTEIEADKNVVYEAVQKKGIVANIEELKPIQIVRRLKQICGMYNVKCDDSTLNYLIEISGTNLQSLINEIRKLIEFAGKDGTITKDAVDNLAVRQIESVIFELTDNLAIRKIDVALDILDNLIYQKEAIQKILVTLYNHFKKIYLCTIAMKENRDIVTSLDLKPNQTFLVSKYKKQASYFKEDELRKILKELIDLDYNFKNGKIDLDLGLRSILCNYCS